MPAVPAIVFLIAALGCSFIGRILLVKAAFGVSTTWGLSVLFVPFGPLFFRMNYRELAHPTRYWRLATMPLLLLFVFNGGSLNSLHSLTDFGKPAGEEASAGDTHFHLPVPSKVVAGVFGQGEQKVAAATPTPAPAATSAPAAASAAAPAATPSKAVAAAMSAMPAAPKVLSLPERIDANRKEFERLAEWYTNLKNERGYLRKGDAAAVDAFNAEAARYQTALQLAKTEQADLAKLTARK
jgi:hypothetical protein